MIPEKQLITCVMVNDPTKIEKPTKLTNYHVNRIQVNCYSSSEANDLTNSATNSTTNSPTNSPTNSTLVVSSINGSSSPTNSSASSTSSRLFFVDQKLNQPNCINKSESITNSNNLKIASQKQRTINNVQIKCSNNQTNNSPNNQQTNVHNGVQSNVQTKSEPIKYLNKFEDKLIVKSDSQTKSIYSEQSLKKQIQQFKERQKNQLRFYSSTSSSSTSSTTSSKQFLDKQNLIDRTSSESEPLSSFNYSLNCVELTSNCSTTDTLITNATIRSKSTEDEPITIVNQYALSNDEMMHCTPKVNKIKAASTNRSSNVTTNKTSNSSNPSKKSDSSTISTRTTISKTDETEAQLSKNKSINYQTSSNQNSEQKVNLNELYLFSIKRPTELKHYTHEIKFMKVPGCSLLTSFLIFTAILIISLLFTIGLYISVQVLDEQPLTERTFEGQMVSLSIGRIWNNSIISTNLNNSNRLNNTSLIQQLNQLIADDLRTKFELVFNRSEFAGQFKRVEIVNIRNLNDLIKLNQSNLSDKIIGNRLKSLSSDSSNKSSITEFSNNYLNEKLLIEFKVLFSSTDSDLELSASSVYLTISSELIKLNESLFNNYNLDQSSLNVKEIFPEHQLDKAIQHLLRLVLNNSNILNNRRLKRLQLIKLNRLNRTKELNIDEIDYLPIENQPDDMNKIRCEDKKLPFCQFLPYTSVMYPNLANHHNLEELEKDFIYFRQIMDSECFYLAKEFICLVLNPVCPSSSTLTNSIPCVELCNKFISSCSVYIPAQISDKFYSCDQQLNKLQDNILLFKNKTNSELSNFSSITKNNIRINSSQMNKTEKTNLTKTNKFNEDKNDLKDYFKNQNEKTIERLSNSIVRKANDDKQISSISLTNEVANSSLNNDQNNLNEFISVNDEDKNNFEDKINDLSTDKTSKNLTNTSTNTSTSTLTNTSTIVSTNTSTSASTNTSTELTNRTSSLNNNQHLDNNCFNLEDLEQLNLSVRTLN